MSCREHSTLDWTTLVARRREAEKSSTGQDPAGWDEAWDEAIARIDACDDCRREALMADPTLVFRRLPRVETSAADVESMRQAVASLRRASRVSEVAAPIDADGSADGTGRRRWGTGLRRAAAAVLLAAAGFAAWLTAPALVDGPGVLDEALTAATDFPVTPLAAGGSVAPALPVPAVPGDLAGVPVASGFSAEDLASRPVFEELSQPQTADVYQVGEEDLLVVMVVDETLDI